VIVEAYTQIDIKEKKKEQARLEEEAKSRQRKYDAVKTVFRMMRLTEKKKELYEAGGLEYKKGFFDFVFDILKKERYEKAGSQIVQRQTTIDKGKQLFKKHDISSLPVDKRHSYFSNPISPKKGDATETNNKSPKKSKFRTKPINQSIAELIKKEDEKAASRRESEVDAGSSSYENGSKEGDDSVNMKGKSKSYGKPAPSHFSGINFLMPVSLKQFGIHPTSQ